MATLKDAVPTQDDPLWYKDAVIYQLHVRSFFDSNGDGIGDFPGLTEKLDYIERLGVNAIWLLPFYPSPMRDDGYDISDYRGINPVYGTHKDFRALINEAHRRGLKVITELIVNHTSDQHPWFQAARSAPRDSAKRNFYVWSDTDERFPDTRIIFSDTEDSNWAWDPVARQYYWHRFFTHQPDLNHNNPQVVKAVIRVMRFWLDMGVDGLRLDAIPYLCVREGTDNENLPETHAVVRQMRAAIDGHYRNRMLLAEANQWPEDVRDYFGNGDECHMAYHFPLMPRMYMAIAQEDRHPIVEIIEQTPDIPPTCQWAIFLRNHDELTLEMVTDRERDYMYQTYATDQRMRVNVGIRRRLAPLMDNDMAKIQLMNSLLFSMPGSPTVYYGDELGMGDNIYLGDRNAVRTPMQWSPDRNGGFSRADPQSLFLPPIMDPIYGYQSVNVEAQAREPASLLNWTRRMLGVRKGYKAFGRGSLEFLRPGNRKILAYVRKYEDEVLLCVANLKRSAQPVELDLAAYRGRVPIELIGRSAFPPIGELPYLLTLPGYGFYWFELAAEAAAPSWHQEHLVSEEPPWLVLFDSLASFDLRVAQDRRPAAERLVEQLEKQVLPSYLPNQRWYAAKSRVLEKLYLENVCQWTTSRGSWLLTFVCTDFADGSSQRYFLPLALDWGRERAGLAAAVAVARVRQRASTGLLFDAFAEPNFCRDLIAGLSSGQSWQCGEGTLHFLSTAALSKLGEGLDEAAIRRPATESSNFTVLIGARLFLKAFRRVQSGIHPEWEMGRFLTDESPCEATVPTVGSIEHRSGDGRQTTIALIQARVVNQGDGWRYTLQYLERAIDDALTRSPDETLMAIDHTSYLVLVRILALRTAQLHRALAVTTGNRAFDPEPFDAERMREWASEIDAEIAATMRLLRERRGGLPGDVANTVEEVLEDASRLHGLVGVLAREPVQALSTRFHGDYHLSQVLVTENDFVITDLEGEPGRSFDERRVKGTPLKDVGGMLRSFDYAKAVTARQFAAKGATERAGIESLLDDWCARARAEFASAYRDAMHGCEAYPRSGDQADRLIRLAVIQRLLYEIRYELDHRPDWLVVALRDLSDVFREA
jgi:maltose alpha-D-glucosyltransferase/alpha-amylase